jgi:hypothetical protein
MNIEATKGSKKQAEDYINKRGKWEEKGEQIVFVNRHGEIKGKQGVRNDITELYNLIKIGASDFEIMEANPKFMFRLNDVERIRQKLNKEKYKNEFRMLENTYLWGKTSLGKTRSIMELFGYENVYRVTDYRNPYDLYAQEDILILDEYFENFTIPVMNNLLDGYPLSLPARYFHRQACFTKVYIISNSDLFEQYKFEQDTKPDLYEAFLRRIHKVIKFTSKAKQQEFTIEEYKKQSLRYNPIIVEQSNKSIKSALKIKEGAEDDG